MSMVKAYDAKNCSELQLWCSSWPAANRLSRNPLTRQSQMKENETWTWESTVFYSREHSNTDDWSHSSSRGAYYQLEPPPEFQDSLTPPPHLSKFASAIISKVISDAFLVSSKISWSIPCSQDCHMSDCLPASNTSWNGFRLCWTPELLPQKRLGNLSASHNSLSTISSSNVDDSSYIKSAVSHDVLTTKQISDMYNVPFDSDIYALPVDMVHRRIPSLSQGPSTPESYVTTSRCSRRLQSGEQRRSGSSSAEPIHVTVEEVRQYLHTLYCKDANEGDRGKRAMDHGKHPFTSLQNSLHGDMRLNAFKSKGTHIFSGKSKKAKENVEVLEKRPEKFKKCRQSFSTNFKETLCNIFRIKKLPSPDNCLRRKESAPRSDEIGMRLCNHEDLNPPSPITKPPFSKRALPPLPHASGPEPPTPPPLRPKDAVVNVDFASSIEKVKDYGWYWGPISGEAAEKILSNEPDGSFIVRDSSDDYYIFSLTFKLNSIIRHVRIEHDKGNFSFGSSTKFKSHTIVDFIESAVEHSRSGRYLFFLHRRPVLGPMRVQLLHPVSRFKQVQSLQHMCRFVILKLVRRDLIPFLPLPRRVLDYLSTQHYYAEDLLGDEQNSREDLDQLLPFRQEVFS